MQRLQAFKFELLPDGEQERTMRRFAGACRFVYNEALVLQKARYERGEKKLGYAGLCELLTAWRNSAETPWLRDAPTHPLQQVLKDLERAYKNFFAQRSRFPKFKKRGQHASFRYPDPKQFKLDQVNGRLFLPKLGWMRLRLSRAVLGAPCNATVSLRAGKWYVSIQTERDVEPPVPQATGAVGIDVGIARFATFSDGTSLAPLNSFRRHEAAASRAAGVVSQGEVQPQLEEGQGPHPKNPCPNGQRPSRLSAQGHERHQQEPRDGVYRGPAGEEPMQVSRGNCQESGPKRSGQGRSEQVHPRPRLVRVPSPIGIQAPMDGWNSHRGTTPTHQSTMSAVWLCERCESTHAGEIPLRGMPA